MGNGFFAVAVSCGLCLGFAAVTGDARAEEDWRALYRDARPVLDVRYRFEFVDQDSRASNARANTIRTRAGFETGKVWGLGAGFDYEWIAGIGGNLYNDTISGNTRYPVVADPDDLALNQLFLVSNGTIPKVKAKIGRQRIVLDDSRFVGNVGFRQNEQTFDAARVSTTALDNFEFEYLYIEEVHRIFGEESGVGRFEMNSHALRAQYSGLDFVTITPFALLLDYDRRTQFANSSASFGALFDGSRKLDADWTFKYHAGFARQTDHADNPANFGLWYFVLQPGLAWGPLSASLGYEVLEGNGAQGFRTPLATLHKFNGFTDQFLTTPATGIQDLYVRGAARLPGEGAFAGFAVKGGYHEFWAENGGAHYGREWDLGVFKTVKTDYGKFAASVQYADYKADRFSLDTRKLWVTLRFSLAPKPYRSLLSEIEGE